MRSLVGSRLETTDWVSETKGQSEAIEDATESVDLVSTSVGELWSGRVAVWESYGVGELRCRGFKLWVSYVVVELHCGGVAL